MNAKVANSIIIGLILIGTVFLGSFVKFDGGNVMSTLFLGFFALIVAVQLVPALMLAGALVRSMVRVVMKDKTGKAAR